MRYQKGHQPTNGFIKGHTPWHKGKTGVYTDEQLTRITEANRKNAQKKREDNNHNWKGGKPECSDCGKTVSAYSATRCKKCANAKRSGENHPMWQGGVTSENKLARHNFRQTVRKLVLERDNYTCKLCDQYGGVLHVDHMSEWAYNSDLRFDTDNCRTLCRECHYYVTFGRVMPVDSQWGFYTKKKVRV